jgi:hypothetical protein
MIMGTPFDSTGLEAPAPVYDTEDLAAVLALPDLELMDGESDAANVFWEPRDPNYRVLRDREHYRSWLAEAKALARAGVIPGPSHYEFNGGHWPVFSRGFVDVDSAHILAPPAPSATLLFGYRLDYEDDLDALPHLPNGYAWRALTAQSAGMLCNHPRFIGIVLEPRSEVLGVLSRLIGFADMGGHHCIGGGPVPLGDLVRYGTLLEDLDLSCEMSYEHLEEAVYPLDRSCAEVLSATPVPSASELWPVPESDEDGTVDHLMSLLGAWPVNEDRWGVWVIGPNCD